MSQNDTKINKRERIVLVGGKGFIGSKLFHDLAKNKLYDIEVWDLPDGDVREPAMLAEKFAAFVPDIVVNFAGLLGGVQSKNISDIFRTNFVGNLNLLEKCAEHGVKKFIFASSLTVHGSNDPASPQTLYSPFRPIHAYGASKAAAEYAMAEFAKGFGITAISLRPTMVLGDTLTSHAPIEFIRSLLKGDDIIIYGTGEHEREWVWIDDAATGFKRAIEFSLSAPAGYYPFFLSGNRIAMRNLAQKCVERLGGNIKFLDSTSKSFTLTADSGESDRIFGWGPTVGIDEMVERLIAIQKTKFDKA